MEGIHVFNQVEITEPRVALPLMLVAVGTVILIVGLVLFIEFKKDLIGILLVCVGTITILSALPVKELGRHTGEYEYTVTIDNGVNLLEFNEKYEILRQEGELYIIKEK